jgi:hypothetical protein
VELGASRGTPDSLVLRTVSFDPKPRTFGNRLVVVHVGAIPVCLGLPCKVYKSIDCRPLTVM